jgi:hypothetical protein
MTVAGMWKLAIMSSIVPLNVDGRKNTPRKNGNKQKFGT